MRSDAFGAAALSVTRLTVIPAISPHWQTPSLCIFQHKKKKRVAFQTCLKRFIISTTTNRQRRKGGGLHGTEAGKRVQPRYISSQEIVGGHLYFITMISSFHLPLAALPLSLIAVFSISRKLVHLCSTTLPNNASEEKKMLIVGDTERGRCVRTTASPNINMSLVQWWLIDAAVIKTNVVVSFDFTNIKNYVINQKRKICM